MAHRWRPKSPGAGHAEAAGVDAIAEYGWGDLDPATGLYEGYDLPSGFLAPKGDGVPWTSLMADWALVEHSFHAVLGVDLDAVRRSRSWRWFTVRLRGLLATDTPLAARYAPEKETA